MENVRSQLWNIFLYSWHNFGWRMSIGAHKVAGYKNLHATNIKKVIPRVVARIFFFSLYLLRNLLVK